MPEPSPSAPARPNRLKLVFVTWLGIWPLITAVLWLLLPVLMPRFPLPVVTLIVTLLVVPTMHFVVMPLLMRWFGRWVHL